MQLLQLLPDFFALLVAAGFDQLEPDFGERLEEADLRPDLEALLDAEREPFASVAVGRNLAALKPEIKK